MEPSFGERPQHRANGRPAPANRERVSGAAVLAIFTAFMWLGPAVGESRAAASVDLDQWASLDLAWQNGNLNGNNSQFPEGGVVPFRLAMEGLTVGTHEIRISYDFTAGGHKAYDFLATWNATHGAGSICTPSGGAISSMCPALPGSSTFTFPGDPFVTDGLSVLGAQQYAGVGRRLTIWGGTITSISAPTHSGSAAGNSEVDLLVRFKSTGSAVLLAWGGHLAQSSYWNKLTGGSPDGASLVSGAPWHVRTLGLDGSGSRNQDRSIQPSAIVGELPPGGAAPPTPPPVLPPLDPPAGPAGPGGPPAPGLTLPDTASVERLHRPSSPNLLAPLVLLAAGLLNLIVWRRWLRGARAL